VNPYGRLVHGQNHEIFYELEQPETVIGRSETCDIRLDDPYVSRRQAKIFQDKGCVHIENLGRNPILLNGEFIEKSILQSGDMLLFGKTQVVFQLKSPSRDETTELDDAGLDPEMTCLLPEHQALRSIPEQVSAGRPAWGSVSLRTWSALLLVLLMMLFYTILRLR
jgi:pSer/pThr/pTyr-binding forkhead associated (FHA) protein